MSRPISLLLFLSALAVLDKTTATCRYRPRFGAADDAPAIVRGVARFCELVVNRLNATTNLYAAASEGREPWRCARVPLQPDQTSGTTVGRSGILAICPLLP
jgi:hypothetical protein